MTVGRRYERPAEPLVERNPLRRQTFDGRLPPAFHDIKDELPIPILPQHPDFVEMYWRAWEIAWSRLRAPRPGSGLIVPYQEEPETCNLSMWRNAFLGQFGLYGRRLFDFMGLLDNFYARQHSDGFICSEINPDDGRDYFDPFDPNATGPNILAWAEWRYFRLTGDDSRFKQVFWPLMAYHRWCRLNRSWPNGLYWATGLSSGMDNQPRVPGGRSHHRHWSWVDATIQASLSCLALGRMATLLREDALASELAEERFQLLHLINDQMWNRATGFYHDIDAHGRHNPAKSIGAYWALLDNDLVPMSRFLRFVQHLRDEKAFRRPHSIPSLSADSEGYDAEGGKRWRGGVWSPMNFIVIKGLRAAARHVQAHGLALRHLQSVSDVFQRTDTLWEYYAAESNAPGKEAKPDYVGWTGLTPIAMLMEDVIGISVDWPLRRVTWDLRLDTAKNYGVRNFPLGSEGTASFIGNRRQVEVTTNVPFTMIVNDDRQCVQTRAPAGVSVIDME